MPTVGELITQIADDTGLAETAGEGAVILRAINRAYRRVAGECLTLKASGTITGDGISTSFVLASFLPTLSAIDAVYLYDGSDYLPLSHVTMDAVQDAVRSTGTPAVYAASGGTLYLPCPVATTSSLFVRFTARPSALTALSTEADLAGVEPMFHEDVLGTLASAYVLEGHEGEEQRAAYFRGLHKDAMVEFKRHLTDKNGIEMANDRAGAPHFSTPAPMDIR